MCTKPTPPPPQKIIQGYYDKINQSINAPTWWSTPLERRDLRCACRAAGARHWWCWCPWCPPCAARSRSGAAPAHVRGIHQYKIIFNAAFIIFKSFENAAFLILKSFVNSSFLSTCSCKRHSSFVNYLQTRHSSFFNHLLTRHSSFSNHLQTCHSSFSNPIQGTHLL